VRPLVVLGLLSAACSPPRVPAHVDLSPQTATRPVLAPRARSARAFSWTATDLPAGFHLVAAAGHAIVYLAAAHELRRSTDGGATFVELALPPPASPHDDGMPRAMWAEGDRLVVATEYAVFGSADRGASWSRLAEPTLPSGPPGVPSPIQAVWGARADLYFATNVGEVHHSSDAGRTWRVWSSHTGGAFLGLGGAEDGTLAVVGCFGFFFRSSDRGASWTRGASFGDDTCAALVAAADARRFAVVRIDRELVRTEDAGAHWERVDAGIAPHAVSAAWNDWIVVGDGVARSLDGGVTWRRESVSLGPPAPFVADRYRGGKLVLVGVARAGDEAYAVGRRTDASGEDEDGEHAVIAIARSPRALSLSSARAP